jgi:hypothetical protein
MSSLRIRGIGGLQHLELLVVTGRGPD